jgi:hypothetical protein
LAPNGIPAFVPYPAFSFFRGHPVRLRLNERQVRISEHLFSKPSPAYGLGDSPYAGYPLIRDIHRHYAAARFW